MSGSLQILPVMVKSLSEISKKVPLAAMTMTLAVVVGKLGTNIASDPSLGTFDAKVVEKVISINRQ